MPIDPPRLRSLLRSFDFTKLFVEELGWERHQAAPLRIALDGTDYTLEALAHKRGMVAYRCAATDTEVPDYATRRKIEKQVAKTTREHLIIYTDAARTMQRWQWVRREMGRPDACREHLYHVGQPGDALIQKLQRIAFSLDEEERLTHLEVLTRAGQAFDVDRITKRFYDRFKTEHTAFLGFIKGIREEGDREWYASLMLNRLMFIYFIQKKGFLDGDSDYLRNRLRLMQQRKGKNHFLSFYRYFLRRLFHEGLGSPARSAELDQLLGKVPFLNGGLFEEHEIELRHESIDIADAAFERLFAFFDAYQWHLDERPLRADNEINPDVLGYIFEKYINQKQMGAYYTKEDITGYIAQNTVLPFLLDAAERKCAIAFRPDGAVWRLLRDDPDRYLYPAVRHGVDLPMPDDIAVGLDDVDCRGGWNRPAAEGFALPTETWREHVTRRRRCHELRAKLRAGEVHAVNDLITYNLDIRRFVQDAIENCEGPELLRAFWKALEQVSILDPTCGSGAFLFAALNILEPLYDACLERMQIFIDDLERAGEKHHPEKFADFRKILARVALHPNRRYFILKSIIVHNLFGVDIMEEAVEICKLRLFLKLVAQVDDADQVEPLPDIDFNMRAGNTLVGFTSLEQVKQSMKDDWVKLQKLPDIAERAEIADRAFRRFHEMQTEHGMDAKQFAVAKGELRRCLDELDDELDRFLATGYGVKLEREKALLAWQESHQPFHWFVEFFGIIVRGGFDVIIGNPPYVELKEVEQYQLIGYACEDSGNLYALVLERCVGLASALGRLGFIVPVSSVSTDRYSSLQRLLITRQLHYSSFDDRPSRLFDGLEHIRLTIHLLGSPSSTNRLYSTRYNKWSAPARPVLFEGLRYATACLGLVDGSLPKLTSEVEHAIIERLIAEGESLSSFYARGGRQTIFYSRKVGYFLQVLNFMPRVLDGRGRRRPPTEFKELRFSSASHAELAPNQANSPLVGGDIP